MNISEIFMSNGKREAEMQIPLSGALMVGNTNPEDKLSDIQNDVQKFMTPESISSFGLFGGESQYNHFVPGVSSDEWTPKEEDFIYPVFRLFSEVIVSKMGIPIDFTNGILKNYYQMAKNITVYPDHKNDEVGNHLGVVKEVEWQESYNVDGVKVPAGINGVLKLDAKSNPRIARGVLMDPPAIHSGSVTVRFEWEKSHTSLTDDEFWDKLGTYDKDGNLIRILVTRIKGFNEYSLVSNGADPFARQLKDNKIVNPAYANTFRQFSMSIDNSSISNPINNKPMEFINLFKSQFGESFSSLGLSEESPEKFVEDLVTSFKDFQTKSQELASLKEAKEDLTPESLTQLISDSNLLAENKENLQFIQDNPEAISFIQEEGGLEAIRTQVSNGKSYVEGIKQSAIASYKLLAGENANELIENTISESSLEAALAFKEDYANQVEKALPLTCQSCGSHEISRASHKSDDLKNTKSFQEEIEEEYSNRTRKPSQIHGE